MAYYDLKKKPSLTTKEGEKEVYYPQAVFAGFISAEKLVQLTSKFTGFSEAEIKGVLTGVFDAMTDSLNQGYRVEMGDFGYFTGKVKGRLVEKKTDIRGQSITFNNVNFRPSATFKKALNAELVRVPDHKFRQSTNVPMEKLEQRLLDYLDKHGFINAVNYTRITGRLKWKAAQDLKYFVEKGVIISRGNGSQKHYVKKITSEE